MRTFIYKEIKGSDEERLLANSNKTLISNFNKVAKWIEENCPHLNGEFECSPNPYYWISIVIEDGKAYLEEGSHGWEYKTALSTTETATFSRGSMQSTPYAYRGVQFFPNKRLEEFLKEWPSIKGRIIAEKEAQERVYGADFEA